MVPWHGKFHDAHPMVTVHKAAEEIEEKAKKDAEEMYAKTRAQADAMADRAQKEYDQILNTAASAEADRIVRDARKRIERKAGSYSGAP